MKQVLEERLDQRKFIQEWEAEQAVWEEEILQVAENDGIPVDLPFISPAQFEVLMGCQSPCNLVC